MKTLEFNPDGSGILSIFHGHYWERVQFEDMDELEVYCYFNGLLLKDNSDIWYDAYRKADHG